MSQHQGVGRGDRHRRTAAGAPPRRPAPAGGARWSRPGAALALWLLIGLGGGGCTEKPDSPVSPPLGRVTYEGRVKAILDARCVACHRGLQPEGEYDLSTYEGVLGTGTDAVPNAIPGQANSLLVTRSLPGGGMDVYYAGAAQAETVRRWVVEERLARR